MLQRSLCERAKPERFGRCSVLRYDSVTCLRYVLVQAILGVNELNGWWGETDCPCSDVLCTEPGITYTGSNGSPVDCAV